MEEKIDSTHKRKEGGRERVEWSHAEEKKRYRFEEEEEEDEGHGMNDYFSPLRANDEMRGSLG